MHRVRQTWGRIFHLAWPVMAEGSVRTSMRTVDVLVVGAFIGPAAVAAVGIGDVFARIVLHLALGLGAGTIALVSQSYGAERFHYANRVTTQTAVLSVLLGIPVTAIGWVFATEFYRLLGAPPEVTALGTVYLQVIMLSATFRVNGRLLDRALQGAGDTRTPVVINIAGTVTNIVVTVVLVVGVGPVPSYGILGAAVGTALGNGIAAASYVVIFSTSYFRVRFTRDGLWDPALLAEILRIGIPQAIERNVTVVGDLPLNAIILVFGTEANAAFQIGRRIQQYIRMPNWGISTAASTLVGNAIGRGDTEESDRYAVGSVTLAVAITVLVGGVAFAVARPLAALFTNDPLTIRYTVEWIRALAIATVMYSVFSPIRGAFQGAGQTKWPLYASIIGIFGFSIGFSYLVGVRLGIGIVAVYVGMVLDFAARSTVLYVRYRSGKWKQVRIDQPGGTTDPG